MKENLTRQFGELQPNLISPLVCLMIISMGYIGLMVRWMDVFH